MAKHYSGSPAPSSMTHGSGDVAGAEPASERLGPGPGKAAQRVSPSRAENPTRATPKATKAKSDDGEA
jgi:hypothetical protein